MFSPERELIARVAHISVGKGGASAAAADYLTAPLLSRKLFGRVLLHSSYCSDSKDEADEEHGKDDVAAATRWASAQAVCNPRLRFPRHGEQALNPHGGKQGEFYDERCAFFV